MKFLRIITSFLTLAAALALPAQTRSVHLTVNIRSVEGDNLYGQSVRLVQTDYSADYTGLKLDASGQCSLNVYPGNHAIEVDHEGFEKLSESFMVAATPAEQSVTFTLTEKTRRPFALTASVDHDVMTGNNDISLQWNREEPAFFDDFESYDSFATTFGDWTGIDADGETAAQLAGSYPNKNQKQYAQIINPLTVVPTWWYDYPVLRPCSGQQYAGFIRTASGNPNDDWLISPPVTVGTGNVLQFMAKAADRYAERFQVYVTEVIDNPGASDFIRLDKGNYESVDYTQWHKMSYDLSGYEGKRIRFAIRYIAQTSLYGAFMLMVDDVFVGQPEAAMQTRARRVAKSPDNANENFEIYLDSKKVGYTGDYSFVITGVAPGTHIVGVKAKYLGSESEMTTLGVDVATQCSEVTLDFTTNSILDADGQMMELLCLDNARTYSFTVDGGKVVIPFLPYGNYEANVAEGAFCSWSLPFEVNSPRTNLNATLLDRILKPWNITASTGDDGSVFLLWNQNLGFTDSFEDYDDFATGSFGGWTSLDVDRLPVYTIGLGGATNIVIFPGSGTAANPLPLAPVVFNPWNTVPAMLPTDASIQAPDGDKTVVFFSPQRAQADKWLISPPVEVHDGYEFSIVAKAYDAAYPEAIDMCVAEEGSTPDDFMPVASVSPVAAGEWVKYSTELDSWAGKTVRVALHYYSYDAFLVQVDMVAVEPAEGTVDQVDFGNIDHYEIYVDGILNGTSKTPSYTLAALPGGNHTIGIKAVYMNGESEMAEYNLSVSGIDSVKLTPGETAAETLYDLTGRRIDRESADPGIYISVRNGKSTKVILR